MSDPADQSIASMTLSGYLGALNSKSPTPGGGAVAGTNGATAAAIAGMVVQYTLGKKKYAEYETDNQFRLDKLTQMQSGFLQLADDDAAGYGVLNELWSLPETDPKRIEEWDSAVQGAISPPSAMLDLCVKMMGILEELTQTTNRMLQSDLAVAAITCRASAHSAACNIRINISLLPEDEQPAIESSMNERLSIVDAHHDKVMGLVS